MPKRCLLAAVIALLALLGSGCGSSHSYPDSSCPAVLGQVGSAPPEGFKVMGQEVNDLNPLVTPGTMLGTLASRVISALNSLENDQPATAAYRAAQAQYISDATQIQHYCDQ
jgi:hypothetical protein